MALLLCTQTHSQARQVNYSRIQSIRPVTCSIIESHRAVSSLSSLSFHSPFMGLVVASCCVLHFVHHCVNIESNKENPKMLKFPPLYFFLLAVLLFFSLSLSKRGRARVNELGSKNKIGRHHSWCFIDELNFSFLVKLSSPSAASSPPPPPPQPPSPSVCPFEWSSKHFGYFLSFSLMTEDSRTVFESPFPPSPPCVRDTMKIFFSFFF